MKHNSQAQTFQREFLRIYPKNRYFNISIVGVGNSECPPSLSGGSTRTCFTCRSPKCNDGFKPNSQFTENELTKLGQLNRWIAGNCHGNAGSAYQMSVPHQSVRAASNPIPNSMMTKTNRKSIQPRNGKSSWGIVVDIFLIAQLKLASTLFTLTAYFDTTFLTD